MNKKWYIYKVDHAWFVLTPEGHLVFEAPNFKHVEAWCVIVTPRKAVTR